MPVGDDDAVDLTGFDRVAMAFDRAAQFFHNSRATIQSWEDELGNGGRGVAGPGGRRASASSTSSGINYQKYTDTLPSVAGGSKVGDELRTAKSGIYNAIVEPVLDLEHVGRCGLGNPLRVAVRRPARCHR